ncbi:MAG TPA: DnaB-like helicase C-terminal domain-containing protein, partial [Pilimelia sp.]|nr:DnaB-like helicase C-terminal domain-containing protein [Pilimelia sp.]
FGISARLVAAPRRAAVRQPAYALDVPGPDDRERLRREIGLPGRSATAFRPGCDALAAAPGGKTVPHQVWHRVRDILADSDAPRPSPSPEMPGRQRLRRIAAVLDANDLDLHATNDVLWEEVVAIDPMGERDVFDATVLGVHNFIADGIAVHNSIEQDADVVILLHRDDYYDKESPRAGEADFIVAKHRNGPTDTVTVAAQLHFSRFVDMAIQ